MSKPIEIYWEPCPGEAHRNPMIDNCGGCAPLWGIIARTLDPAHMGKKVWVVERRGRAFRYERDARRSAAHFGDNPQVGQVTLRK